MILRNYLGAASSGVSSFSSKDHVQGIDPDGRGFRLDLNGKLHFID
jgi:hypothetical protein